ncbi:MAG: hypothetical protein CL946_06335 [Ectothiorhodospiraceae bacterium]|nr:hypothetical protein [Ectothiorhodospiraceae bacterium]
MTFMIRVDDVDGAPVFVLINGETGEPIEGVTSLRLEQKLDRVIDIKGRIEGERKYITDLARNVMYIDGEIGRNRRTIEDPDPMYWVDFDCCMATKQGKYIVLREKGRVTVG